MQVTHTASGAVLGKFIPNPILAFLAAIVLHLTVVDKIPHWWAEPQKPHPVILFFDYALAIALIAVFYYTGKLTPGVIWAIAGSLATDIVLVGIIPIKKSKFGLWHSERQPHLDKLYTLTTDGAVILVSLIIIYFVR